MQTDLQKIHQVLYSSLGVPLLYSGKIQTIAILTGVDYDVVDASCRYLAKRDNITLLEAATMILKELR